MITVITMSTNFDMALPYYMYTIHALQVNISMLG